MITSQSANPSMPAARYSQPQHKFLDVDLRDAASRIDPEYGWHILHGNNKRRASRTILAGRTLQEVLDLSSQVFNTHVLSAAVKSQG